jgi:hypothetical protein
MDICRQLRPFGYLVAFNRYKAKVIRSTEGVLDNFLVYTNFTIFPPPTHPRALLHSPISQMEEPRLLLV